MEVRNMPLLDFYGDFCQATQTCRYCGWTGLGEEMESGEWFGDGVEKHCPACGEKHRYVQWSVAVADDAPADWRARIGRVAD